MRILNFQWIQYMINFPYSRQHQRMTQCKRLLKICNAMHFFQSFLFFRSFKYLSTIQKSSYNLSTLPPFIPINAQISSNSNSMSLTLTLPLPLKKQAGQHSAQLWPSRHKIWPNAAIEDYGKNSEVGVFL